ncbi:type 2 periplasmic-binding domain-containing protein [Alkalihalobacterium elongatum]|uniref:TRAP transporter substrate-binding protein DctP n=1 Tax=Alkalihalobacterium elongatum TaxID=2675466 RepID=UPI001C1FC64F|nr:TRAP transporter substrate-binding protein DctP [Alkalihalobacterium elongatum]
MRQMKKGLLLTVFSLIALVFIGCSSNQSSAPNENNEGNDNNDATNNQSEETIVLRASSGLPSHHVWLESFVYGWMERVEEESNGRVQFEVFTGGELVPLGGEFDALNAGTIDIALPVMHLYDPHRFPLSEITMIPLTASGTEVVNNAYHNLVYSDRELQDGKTFYELEMEANGLKAWAMNAGEAYVINTVGKEFNSPEDFNNARIRTGARLSEMFITNLGATSISMPQTDSYDALSRGALDGNLMTVGDWMSWGFQDLIKYVLEGANIGHFTSVLGMTQEKWDSLPADIQEIMDTAAKELQVAQEANDYMVAKDIEVRELVEGEVVFKTINDLDDETRDHVVQAMEKTWLDWIELIEAQGSPGKEVAKLWRDLIIEAGGDVPDAVRDLE